MNNVHTQAHAVVISRSTSSDVFRHLDYTRANYLVITGLLYLSGSTSARLAVPILNCVDVLETNLANIPASKLNIFFVNS